MVTMNKGIGFGLFGGNEMIGLVINLLGVFLAGYLFIVFDRSESGKRKNIYLLLLSLVIGGGVSNFIDRIFRGGVVDYINFWIIPSFNLADLIITLSVIGVVILTLFESINERSKKRFG